MAFVLVQHLDPIHAIILTEILQLITAMPLVEAQDQIAPNCDMAIYHGKQQLNLPSEPRG